MKVAIAGANSGVGRHIAEAILAHKGHTLVALTRQPSPELEAKGAQVIVTDYSLESLSTQLEGVHTVISALGVIDGEVLARTEVALVHAAEKAGAKRFVPGGWAGAGGGKDDYISVYRAKYAAIEALGKSSLEWSYPMVGIFLNYFASPKPGGVGYLKPLKPWIDIENCTATIPGDGNLKVVYTAAEDVGEFIAKALDVENWPRELRIIGNQITMNEVIKVGERIRGKPFDVVYQTEEELEKAIVPNPPSPFVNMGTEFSLSIVRGRGSFGPNELNTQIDMRFTTAEEFIQKWWGDFTTE